MKFFYKGYKTNPKAWVELDKFPEMKERVLNNPKYVLCKEGITLDNEK